MVVEVAQLEIRSTNSKYLMADVTVKIKGDSRDLEQEARRAKTTLRGLASAGISAGRQLASSFRDSFSVIGQLTESFFGSGVFLKGIDLVADYIKSELVEAWNEPIRAAEEAGKAFESAFSSVVEFDLGAPNKLIANSRDVVIDLAKETKAEIEGIQEALDELEGGNVARAFKLLEQSAAGLKQLTGLGGLVSDEFKAENLNVQGLKNLKAEQERLLAIYNEQLVSLEAQSRLQARLSGRLSEAPFDPDVPRISGQDIVTDFVTRDGVTTTKQAAQAAKEFEQAKIDNIRADIQAQKTLERLSDSLNTYKTNQVEATFESGLRAESAERERQALADLLETVNTFSDEVVSEFNEAVNTVEIFGGAVADSVTDIILGFEKLEDIGRVVGNIFKQLAADIAAAAIKATALSFLFPGAAAGRGFGGLFKGFLGLTPFASGGIVTGPTPALIGEAGPEAVIPLDKLGGINKVQIEATTLRYDGNEFLIGIRQAENTRGVGF